jgi:hypothetical protein
MIKLDGQPYAPGTPFTRSGISYPGNWYQYADATSRLDMGFTEVADPAPYDQRFWFGYDAEGVLIPRNKLDVQAWIVAEAKATAYTIIARLYDWKALRAMMQGVAIPSDVSTGAQAVRDRCEAIEAETNTAVAIEDATLAIEALEAIDRSFEEPS